MMNPCPQCGTTHVTRLSLIWQQGTQLNSQGGVSRSLEALNVSPPTSVPIARHVSAVLLGALLVAPLVTSSVGKLAGIGVAAGVFLFWGLPLLKRIRWNAVELPYQQRLWANTFACRSCGEQWHIDQSLDRPPAPNSNRVAAVIAALALFVMGPTVVMRGNASEPVASASVSGATDMLLYIHGDMNIRSGPGESYPVIGSLPRGSEVTLGPKDANGWAELRVPGGTQPGYVYRASELVRSYRP